MDSCIAKVLISGLPGCNDLVSCLAEELKAVAATESQPQVIVRPSEVVAFQLLRHHSSSDRQRFTYPAYFYLDQFMHEKMALANEKRQVKRGLLQRIADLEARKKTLTRFQVSDSFPIPRIEYNVLCRIAMHWSIYVLRHIITKI